MSPSEIRVETVHRKGTEADFEEFIGSNPGLQGRVCLCQSEATSAQTGTQQVLRAATPDDVGSLPDDPSSTVTNSPCSLYEDTEIGDDETQTNSPSPSQAESSEDERETSSPPFIHSALLAVDVEEPRRPSEIPIDGCLFPDLLAAIKDFRMWATSGSTVTYFMESSTIDDTHNVPGWKNKSFTRIADFQAVNDETGNLVVEVIITRQDLIHVRPEMPSFTYHITYQGPTEYGHAEASQGVGGSGNGSGTDITFTYRLKRPNWEGSEARSAKVRRFS